MDELIAELVGESEGSEKLDWKILGLFGNPSYDIHTCPENMWRCVERGQYRPIPFSTSLDATRKQLVLEGMTWSIGSSGVCHVGTEHGKGKTPELGFVIAALKARRATLSPGQ